MLVWLVVNLRPVILKVIKWFCFTYSRFVYLGFSKFLCFI